MEKNITSVAIYVRKSREDEDEQTINRQQTVLTDYCKKNGWKYELFKEVGSSQELERPELQNMLEKVKSFHYEGVLIADLDRLSRNTGHFATIKEVFINAGCLTITPSKVYDFSVQEDDLFSDIQSVLAKNEYQTIKRRLLRGSRQSAKDGNWLGKRYPVGYEYDPKQKRLRVTDDAPVIRRLFEEYRDGLSTTDIAHKFTSENVQTIAGFIWTAGGISRLLNNVAYIGHSLYGKTKVVNGKRGHKTNKEDQILVKNTHPAIIDQELWDDVQRIKQDRNSRPIVLKFGKNKFSGLIKCGLCGRIHSFQSSRGGKKRINSCQTRHYKDKDNYSMCPNKGVNLPEFELLFFESFKDYVNEFEKYINLIKASETKDSGSLSDKLNHIERQLKKNEQEVKRVQQGFRMEIYTEEEAAKEIKGLKVQKEALEKELIQLQEKVETSGTDYLDKVLKRLKDFYEGFDSMNESEANDILREFIDVIIYKRVGEYGAEMNIKVVWK